MHKVVQGLMVSVVASTALFAGGKGVSIAAVEPIVIPEVDVRLIQSQMYQVHLSGQNRLYNVGLNCRYTRCWYKRGNTYKRQFPT